MKPSRLPADKVRAIQQAPRTLSLLAIALVVGCHPDTVARYRNGQPYRCHEGKRNTARSEPPETRG